MLKPISRLLPIRSAAAYKAQGGHTLILAGQKGYWGAGVLAATAAARVGSGYVSLATDLKTFPSVKHPDFLTLDKSKIKSISRFASVAVGPGLGVNSFTEKIIKKLMKEKSFKVVLDADALTVSAKKNLYPFPSTWVLTPHEGELARLLGVSANQIKNHREKYAVEAAKRMGCIIVLKGHGTLIAQGKKIYKIKTGNKALAKAGTGDVLTGMIAGLMAQGLTPWDAAVLGATLHGKMADDWIKNKKDYLSLMASDLLGMLPETIYKIRRLS